MKAARYTRMPLCQLGDALARKVGIFAAAVMLVACASPPTGPQSTSEALIRSYTPDPDRPLPVLGRIDATYDAADILWQTLDFSVGAIDPSVNVGRLDGVTSIRIEGYLPGQDFEEGFGRLRIEADLPQGAIPGVAIAVIVAVIDTPGYDAPRFVSGPEAQLQITRISPPDLEIDVYGPMAGTFAATLCRTASRAAPPDTTDCKPIAGAFDTQGSFEALR